MWLLVPEAGARYRIYLMYCLQQGCTVIRLLHMVVVSWAGFGNQATTWGGQTMKAHLSAPQGARNTAQTAKLLFVQINSKLASWKCAHLLTEGTGG